MRSLLFQPGQTPLIEPTTCGAIPCRNEVPINIKKDGRMYRFILRDKVVPEDAYIPLIKAVAFAIQQNEPYSGQSPKSSIKDFLVKNNVVI